MKNIWQELNKELAKNGAPNNYLGLNNESMVPVNALVNGPYSSKPFIDILLKYAPKLQGNELEMVIRALTEKGNKKAVSFLLSMFESENPLHVLAAAANALAIIDDPNTYGQLLQICKNKKFGYARNLLLKNIEKYEILLKPTTHKNSILT